MAITNTLLQNSAAQTIFTSAGSHGDVVSVVYLCNRSATYSTANVFVVQSGGTANQMLNMIYSNVFIAAGDTLVMDMEKIILATGDSIKANCTNNNDVVATVSTLAV